MLFLQKRYSGEEDHYIFLNGGRGSNFRNTNCKMLIHKAVFRINSVNIYRIA